MLQTQNIRSLFKGEYVQTREITLDSFLQELCLFLDLEFLVKFLFLCSNVTRGYTFKIKSSFSQALAPACGALTLEL